MSGQRRAQGRGRGWLEAEELLRRGKVILDAAPPWVRRAGSVLDTAARATNPVYAGVRAVQTIAPRITTPASRTTAPPKPQTRAAASTRVAGGSATSRKPAAPSPKPRALLQEAEAQLGAGARGASDAFTFGLGDHLSAGVGAAVDWAGGEDPRTAYGRRIAAERASDQYDAQHYGAARLTGQIVGTGAQLMLFAPAAGVSGGVRIAQATPLIAREVVALGGAGGLLGVGEQAVSDLMQGRMGTAGDYAGAAAGGVTGALVGRTGSPTGSSAAAGVVTSVAQDLLNGRTVSAERALQAAQISGTLGGISGRHGRAAFDRLSSQQKERIGERASQVRTAVRGDRTVSTDKRRYYLDGGGYTYPDQRTASGQLVESKGGRRADLSTSQRRAYAQPGLAYRVDHVIPADAGVMLALPFGLGGYHLFNEHR